jgi:hypothetical protein
MQIISEWVRCLLAYNLNKIADFKVLFYFVFFRQYFVALIYKNSEFLSNFAVMTNLQENVCLYSCREMNITLLSTGGIFTFHQCYKYCIQIKIFL